MKKWFSQATYVALTLTTLCFSFACGGGGGATSSPTTPTTPATVQSVSVSASASSSTGNMEIGGTRQLSASVKYSDGTTKDMSSSATWASSNSAVATVSTSGLVTAKSAGSTTVSATLNGVTGSSTITVNAATLKSIAINPQSLEVALGSSATVSATGTYSDGSTKDLTSQVTWTTSNASVATVDASGKISVVGAGDCVITATLGNVTVSITVHVPAAPKTLVSLAVATDATSPIAIGATAQFTATATYSDNSTADLTSQVSWSSTQTGVATIDANGVATAVAAGTTEIDASFGGVSASANLQVLPSLVSIDVLPANPALELNTTQQMSASGNYSDGSQQDLSAQVQWASSDPSIASVDEKGLGTALVAGTTNITATLGSVTGTTTLTVHPAHLTSIVVDQDGTTLPMGVSKQLSATGTFSDTTASAITNVTFVSSDPTVLSIDSNGLATALKVGSVTVTATSGDVTGNGTVNVGAAALTSVAVQPASPSVPLGNKQQFSVVGTFTDNTTQALTSGITWQSSDPTVATVDDNGLVSSVAMGSTDISVSVNGYTASSTLTVTEAQLVSVAVTPATATVPATGTQQFTATGTYTDASTQDLTATATWTSSNGATATVSNTGLATGVAAGTATITATSGSVNGSGTLTVTAATLQSIVISPVNVTAKMGTNVQFTATGYYNDGTTKDLTKLATWSSSVSATVSINNQGLATAHKLGIVTISAKMGSVTKSTQMTVVP